MKLFVLLYGVVSYIIGVAGLASIILVLAGLIPYGFLASDAALPVSPVVGNVLLVTLWGLIHTGMARPNFKASLTQFIPDSAERATYVFVAGVTSIVMMGYWQIVPGHVWVIAEGGLAYVLWGLFWFGWVFLLASTFAINHFDLFGLRQVFLNFKNQPRPPLDFVERAMYKYIRHPIQTGVLIGIWATPSMALTQLILSVGFTLYIIIGLWFEERDLVKEHGEAYIAYRKQTGSVLPKIGK
jgi:protein-S-isoprenylcysteine O-methyltransferase Ste14